ncbi:hypothetical protein DLAC_05011 [Tieghemostelium lacteum]|uniref:Uncharacterized protein n=1 Tax=Tieghemostelium lacteum TaxID=361077 RepID=A0A151ZIA3_TIELA|nr:hypothetical protein DLAC_05011 [Tieghemostelium lacteum]|eukprot:KYQ93629.1 hypothetical protein DLAC_05011 [Tieghemostelium lacteum]
MEPLLPSTTINFNRRYSVDSTGIDFKHRVSENRIIKKLKVLEYVNEKRDEFQTKIIKDGQASSLIRTKDKFAFVLGVLNLCIISFLAGKFPLMISYLYTTEFAILFLIRVILYKKKNYHYFLFDFCYYANILLLFYLYVYKSPSLFILTYCISNGPLIVAVIPYRNSMVFHSLDKATSVFIHILPSVVTYSLRWNSPEILATVDKQDIGIGWRQFFFYPILFYVLWQCVYLVYVYQMRKDVVREKGYITSLELLSRIPKNKKPSFITKLLNSAGQQNAKILLIFFQFLYTCLTLIPCRLLYNRQILHSVYIVLILLVSIWNGANFYVTVFSNNYVKEMKDREERWKRIIVSSFGTTNPHGTNSAGGSATNSPVLQSSTESISPTNSPKPTNFHLINSQGNIKEIPNESMLTDPKILE